MDHTFSPSDKPTQALADQPAADPSNIGSVADGQACSWRKLPRHSSQRCESTGSSGTASDIHCSAARGTEDRDDDTDSLHSGERRPSFCSRPLPVSRRSSVSSNQGTRSAGISHSSSTSSLSLSTSAPPTGAVSQPRSSFSAPPSTIQSPRRPTSSSSSSRNAVSSPSAAPSSDAAQMPPSSQDALIVEGQPSVAHCLEFLSMGTRWRDLAHVAVSSVRSRTLVWLLCRDNFALAEQLCEDAVVNSDSLTHELLTLFDTHGVCHEFLQHMLQVELSESDGKHMLFRRNTPATKLLSGYFRYSGADFIDAVLGPAIQDICNSFSSATMSEVTESSGVMSAHLAAQCQALVELVLGNLVKLPRGVRRLAHLIHQQVERLHEGQGMVAVRTFLFLRLLCPAIVNPVEFHILDYRPSSAQTKALVQVAKAVQQLANSCKAPSSRTLDTAASPSRSPRQSAPSFTFDIDSFIEANIETMTQFLWSIAQPVKDSICEDSIHVPFVHTCLWTCSHCGAISRRDDNVCSSCRKSKGTKPCVQQSMDEYIDECSDVLAALAFRTLRSKRAGAHVGINHFVSTSVDHNRPYLVHLLSLGLQRLGSYHLRQGNMEALGRLLPTDERDAEIEAVEEWILVDQAAVLHALIQFERNSSTLARHGVFLSCGRGCGLAYVASHLESLVRTLSLPDLSRWAQGDDSMSIFAANAAKVVVTYIRAVAGTAFVETVQRCLSSKSDGYMSSQAVEDVFAAVSEKSPVVQHIRLIVTQVAEDFYGSDKVAPAWLSVVIRCVMPLLSQAAQQRKPNTGVSAPAGMAVWCDAVDKAAQTLGQDLVAFLNNAEPAVSKLGKRVLARSAVDLVPGPLMAQLEQDAVQSQQGWQSLRSKCINAMLYPLVEHYGQLPLTSLTESSASVKPCSENAVMDIVMPLLAHPKTEEEQTCQVYLERIVECWAANL